MFHAWWESNRCSLLRVFTHSALSFTQTVQSNGLDLLVHSRRISGWGFDLREPRDHDCHGVQPPPKLKQKMTGITRPSADDLHHSGLKTSQLKHHPHPHPCACVVAKALRMRSTCNCDCHWVLIVIQEGLFTQTCCLPTCRPYRCVIDLIAGTVFLCTFYSTVSFRTTQVTINAHRNTAHRTSGVNLSA